MAGARSSSLLLLLAVVTVEGFVPSLAPSSPLNGALRAVSGRRSGAREMLFSRTKLEGRGRMGAAAAQMSGGRQGGREDMIGGMNPVNMELQNAVRCNDLLMIQDMVQAKVVAPDVALCKVDASETSFHACPYLPPPRCLPAPHILHSRDAPSARGRPMTRSMTGVRTVIKPEWLVLAPGPPLAALAIFRDPASAQLPGVGTRWVLGGSVRG